jgi:hypothetical protein
MLVKAKAKEQPQQPTRPLPERPHQALDVC